MNFFEDKENFHLNEAIIGNSLVNSEETLLNKN